MLACCREGGEQAAEGMRGPNAEHQVEQVRGGKVRGFLVVKNEALLDAEAARGLAGLRQGILGDVNPLGLQLRVRGQRTQKPFPAPATKVEYTLVAAREAAFQQPAHRVVVERGLYRVVGMGEPGDLFTIHQRSLTAPEAVRTSFSSAS
ncbi:hypothetical protein GCM10010345_87670 [Streptomyces canarius]|uniref:Head-tail adaptor protein n=1 Tax=Streptomyces canarius TaxID=285453 RepID=A0ABQ3DCD9_9ACTN|nr:hypothetical protein GCM10010345_87670 [Streptomyces canarius]